MGIGYMKKIDPTDITQYLIDYMNKSNIEWGKYRHITDIERGVLLSRGFGHNKIPKNPVVEWSIDWLVDAHMATELDTAGIREVYRQCWVS